MQPRLLQNVSVWLDEGSVSGSVFSQAMDWAFRLSLPLRAVVASARDSDDSRGQESRYNREINKTLGAWGNACREHGVTLETCPWPGADEAAPRQLLHAPALCVFAENQAAAIQQELLFRADPGWENAMLVCPPMCPPLARVLAVCHRTGPDSAYLESVARLCGALEIQPIVLVVAGTEQEAGRQQEIAESVCQEFKLLADIDAVVGCDVQSAVTRVASWRSCSHVIVERQRNTRCWSRQAGTHSVSLLTLPASVVLDVPRKIRNDCVSLLGTPPSRLVKSMETGNLR